MISFGMEVTLELHDGVPETMLTQVDHPTQALRFQAAEVPLHMSIELGERGESRTDVTPLPAECTVQQARTISVAGRERGVRAACWRSMAMVL
jgi:hypothetical protein